jgi:hypothetical protein
MQNIIPGIDTTHGVVAAADPGIFCHRNLLDRDKFARFLAERKEKYVPLDASLRGEGDSLTLDDSTVAAADAARMARESGHAVTLFINGYNIEEQVPYFFSQLNAAFDSAQADGVSYRNKYFPFVTMQDKQRFRTAVKRQLAHLGDEKDRQALVSEVADMLQASEPTTPPFLQPITREDLRELVSLGVDIQNHGWSHVRVGALSPREHAEEIRRGRDWLATTCGVTADVFAVPNGDGLPLWGRLTHYRLWLLLTEEYPQGEIFPSVYNRKTLEV